jgi:hypothetical protein
MDGFPVVLRAGIGADGALLPRVGLERESRRFHLLLEEVVNGWLSGFGMVFRVWGRFRSGFWSIGRRCFGIGA